MKAGEKLVIVLGLGFAAWVIAQTVFRYGAEDDGDIRGSSKFQTKSDGLRELDKAIQAFGGVLGLSWDDVVQALEQDAGVNELKNGTTANVGGPEGRPYIIIDDKPYLLSGR